MVVNNSGIERRVVIKIPIPLDSDSATIRNFGHKDTNRGRNAKSAADAQ